ncbi:hypothetical protein BDZ91DRAFT_296621 [Kalaharituber pfeilii]|nr:hypothetical protein BDZ91DRAFT_296621 [Kalaharituber pfeilii]
MRELRPAPPAQSGRNPLYGTPQSMAPNLHPSTPAAGERLSQQLRQHTRQTPGKSQHQHDHNTIDYSYPIKCEHAVQFYDADAHLYDAISRFLLTSFFSSQEAAVIVATANHITALEHQLFHQHCLFPEVMKRRGQLVTLEADGILESLLAKGLTQQTFNDFLTPLLISLRDKGYGKVLVYGELVNILCERGQHWDALELEKIWNVFLQSAVGVEYGVKLLCGYKLDVFAADEDPSMDAPRAGAGPYGMDVQSAAFREICRTHSVVRPTEKCSGGFGTDESESGYAGSASAVDIPPSLALARSGEKGGMMIAVLEHRIRILEKRALKAKEKERELQRLFNSLPVGIFACHVPWPANPREQNSAAGASGQNSVVPKPAKPPGVNSPSSSVRSSPSASSSANGDFSNPTFAKILGLEKVITTPGAASATLNREWINTYVHPEDRETLMKSLELARSKDTTTQPRRCTYRVLQPDGETKWVLGETVDSTQAGSRSERTYIIHAMTDLTDMMGTLSMSTGVDLVNNVVKLTPVGPTQRRGSASGGFTEPCDLNQVSGKDTVAECAVTGTKRRATEDLTQSPTASHSHLNYTPVAGNQHKHYQIHPPSSSSNNQSFAAHTAPPAPHQQQPISNEPYRHSSASASRAAQSPPYPPIYPPLPESPYSHSNSQSRPSTGSGGVASWPKMLPDPGSFPPRSTSALSINSNSTSASVTSSPASFAPSSGQAHMNASFIPSGPHSRNQSISKKASGAASTTHPPP